MYDIMSAKHVLTIVNQLIPFANLFKLHSGGRNAVQSEIIVIKLCTMFAAL